MQEDVKKLLDMFNSEYLSDLFKKYGLNYDDLENNLSLILNQYRDTIHREYFSFLDKYIGNTEFYKLLDIENNVEIVLFIKLLVSDEFYYSLLDYYYSTKDNINSDGIIIDDKDLEYYLNKGMTLEDIINSYEMLPDMQYKIYLEHPEYIDMLLERNSFTNVSLVAAEVAKGNLKYLGQYLDSYLSFQDKLSKLLVELCKYENVDFDNFFDTLVTKYLGDNDISIINDEDLVKRIVDIGGSKALVFANNPSASLVDYTDFSYYDYSLYNGSFKDSPYLLMKFLNEGKVDALIYASNEAINDDVIEYIKRNNVSLERIKSYTNLHDSFPLAKYFASNNDYSLLGNLTSVLSNLECFEYIYNILVSSEDALKFSYYNSNEIKLLYSIVKHDWSNFSSYYDINISLDVASRLVEIGLTVEEFGERISKNEMSDVFIEAFALKGQFLPLIFANDNKLLDKYKDNITFDLYLEAKKLFNEVKLSSTLLYKFVKEGHYEVLDNDNLFLTNVDLDRMGFDALTYEEYLKLPLYVQNIPLLKQKFLEYDSSYLRDLLKQNPDMEVCEKAILSGMTFDEIEPFIDKYTSFSSKTVIALLKRGDNRGIKYLFNYISSDELVEVVDLYFDSLNGEIPDLNGFKSSTVVSLIIKKFLEIGRFEILDKVDNLYGEAVQELMGPNYTFEIFKKHPVLNGDVISKFITLENEEELINFFTRLNLEKEYIYISNSAELILKMYRAGYSKENIKTLQKIVNIDGNNLLKTLTEDEYDIFNIVDIGSAVNNKVFLANLLNHVSIERIRQLVQSFSANSDTKLFIIRKMVARGYYDFVSYYTDKIEEDVLKRALLSGYFPEKQICDNKYFRVFLSKITFSPEELNYLNSKIEKDVRYIIFFPEIINNPNELAVYIKMNPEIIRLLDNEKIRDINLLKILVKENPKLCSELLYNGIESSNVILLLQENIELLKYIGSSFINIDVVKGMISFYPNILDYYSGYFDNNTILEAIAQGYKFSLNTSPNIIQGALQNGINVDHKILISLSNTVLLKMADYLVDIADTPLYFLFRDLLNKHFQDDKYDFIYDFMCYIDKNYIGDDGFKKIIDSLGIDATKYHHYDRTSKEKFLLSLKLDELPKDDSAIPMFDEILESSSLKAFILEWIDKNFPFTELINLKKQEIAKKYFLEDPLSFIKYADCNDKEIIDLVRKIIKEYPSLYRFVPSILDNKELIIYLIEHDSARNVYSSLADEFKNDLEILEVAMQMDETVFSYVNHNDLKIIDFARNHLFNYPIVMRFVPNLVNDKETALKLVPYNQGMVFYYLPDELKRDYDICNALLDINDSFILEFSRDTERFRDLVYKVLSTNGSYINRISSIIELDEELVIVAMKTYPSALFVAPDEFFNERVYSYLEDITQVDYSTLTLPKILKLIHFANFDINNQKLGEVVVDFIVSNVKSANDIDKNDPKIKEIFSKYINAQNDRFISQDGNFFRKVVAVLPYIDMEIFDEDTQLIFRNALTILSATGKLNTLEKNPVFNFEVVKHIFPLFGVDFVKNLIKYNTPAAKVIVDEIKNNNSTLLTRYYNMICKYNIFPDDDKRMHYAFRDFNYIKDLIIDIINNNHELSNEEAINIRKIIVGRNIYNINTYEDLKIYDKKTQEFWQEKLNTDSIFAIKDALSTLFGYNSVAALKVDFNNFQLDNYLNLKILRDDIIHQYGREKAMDIFKECFYTKKDVAIISLMSRVINSENINELKELMIKLIKEKDGALDYCDEVREIIRKVRLLHNYQFNGRLTKIEDIKSKRLEKDDPNNPYGVTIIDMDTEKFNFLAHRIYSYDQNMSGFKERLMNDPSLWVKLEGASTLSTSSISDKGFWCIHKYDNSGVVYLFNSLPDNFMLFMNGRDLYVEHGGYKIEPTANMNAFTNLDALNQCSCYKYCEYNEVAGFREGMLPCAFACLGDTPNEYTIKAAKYFSDYLGVDIPIIRFHVNDYDFKKVTDLQNSKDEFSQNPNYNAMHSIFFDGIGVTQPSKSIKDKIDFCLDILNKKYQNGEISFEYLSKSLYEMETLVSQIIVDLPECKIELSRIGLFRRSLLMLKRWSKQNVVELETAALGESGIMYKYKENGETYLVKPAVDKKNLKSQPFRASIQEAASKLQEFLSPATSVKVESIGGVMRFSKQEMVELSADNANVLEVWITNGGSLDYQYSSALLREYVIDFLLCNFDCYVGNFIVDRNNNVRGIDKEQSFRFIDTAESLNPDFSFIPNGNSRVPIYKYLFDRYKSGEIDLDLSVVTDTIEKVKLLSDVEYRNIFREYAYNLDKNNADKILDAIIKRRDEAIYRMEEFIEKLQEMKKSEGVTL